MEAEKSTSMRLLWSIRAKIVPFIIGSTITAIALVCAHFAILDDCEDRYRTAMARFATVQRHTHRVESISKTLQINYRFPSMEADVYAFMLDKFVADNSRRHTVCVPWEMYAAMFWVESQFKSNLTSRKNAKGPGQMLESTCKEQCERFNIKYRPNVTVWNYVLNMSLSADYLSRHYKDSDVKSYIGGPGHTNTGDVLIYNDSVMAHYERLAAIFKGVIGDD